MECKVNVVNGALDQQEIDAYLEQAQKRFGRTPRGIEIRLDGDYVDLRYDFGNQPFHRIRRITGYLVGTLDRFNDGKAAEERDRVKHSL